MLNISLLPRPSRSTHKNDKVERNNDVFKYVLDKISREICNDTAVCLASRASLLTNILHGSSVLSAFTMVRVYIPFIVVLPATIVLKDIFDAHIQFTAHRASLKATKVHAPQLLTKKKLPPGTPVWMVYKTSKQKIRTRWVSATVFE